MSDTRTLSSSSSSPTANHVNGNSNTQNPIPADLNNINVLTSYVSVFFKYLFIIDC